MADEPHLSEGSSPAEEVSSLGKALSHTSLDRLESDASQPRGVPYRNGVAQSSRRRRLSSGLSFDSEEGQLSPYSQMRVLVINTGGTIGMMYHNNVSANVKTFGLTVEGSGVPKTRPCLPMELSFLNLLCPEPNTFVKALRKLPILHDEQYAQQSGLYDYYSPESTLVLPLSKQNKRIVYTVLEYCPLLDSCNMTTDDWAKIATDIQKHYEHYVGFVVLHGTDTMAYTASALSFMCENLGKPVILTGSQVPIYEMRNDGRDNLLGALLIAGQFVIPEVCLYFHHKLYRGNRVTKVDSGSFNAFSSPNLPPLANAEVDIKINWDTVWRANTITRFHVHTIINRNVGVLRLFPGITSETVRAFLQPPMEGVVLETYGSGNAPNNRCDLLEEFKKASDRGVLMINCTQCLRGSVTESYATGKDLSNAGLIAGCDMTPEAALAKLSYVLAKQQLSLAEKRKVHSCQDETCRYKSIIKTYFKIVYARGGKNAFAVLHGRPEVMLSENLRGEMIASFQGAKLSLRDSRFIQVIAKSLSISCKEELEAVRDALTPALACAASKIGDTNALEAIREMGSSLSGEDYDGRTPLHIAACEGHLKVVQYLLCHGATVYAKDRYGATPLTNAVKFRHNDVIKLLRKTGAHLSQEELEDVGTELCSLAALGDLVGLESWSLAGVDMNVVGYDGHTPLEVAKAVGNKDVIEFLQHSHIALQEGEYIEFVCPRQT